MPLRLRSFALTWRSLQPSKQMRMAGKVAAPIKRVGAYIRGAGPGPAPAPGPAMDVVEMDTGM